MKFLDCIQISPPVSLVKGKIYSFIEMANVSTVFREPDYIDVKAFSSGTKFEDGDTVIARIEPCLQNGKRFFVKGIGKGFGSTEFLVFRPKTIGVDNKYLYYFMKTEYIQQLMVSSMTGATGRQRVNNDIFADLEISLPDISVQRRIASILSAYDDLIENNRRQIKLLEEAAQRLYREWFVELRFPGHESVKVVDGVPEGWMKGTVDNIVKLLSGYPFKSSEYVSSGKYRLITIKNVKDGEFSPDNVDYIDQLPDKVPSHCILTEGDILLSLTGNIGRVCIVNGYNYLLNQRVAKLQTLHPAYAYCMFRSKEMLNKMTALSNGVAQQNLSPIRAEKIRILIPSSNLLFQFKNIVEPIISQIILLNNQITFACEARDRLLPELMDGEMEV
jgi:type I restriction enzyme S subunit